MAEQRDAPATEGAGFDGVAARDASRSERATRPQQAHVQPGLDAADPLLEVPQAHAVRTRSMRALRIRVRREHGRRVRERSQIAASRDVDAEAVIRATEAHAPRDRGGSPPRQRRDDLRPRTPARERALRPFVSMPDLRPVRLGAVHRVRLRRALRPDVRRHVLVSGVRVSRPVGCGRMPGVQPRFRPIGRGQRLRVCVPAVRSPCDLRCGPLLLRSLVRGLIRQSIGSENRPISPLSFDRVDSSDDGPHRRKEPNPR